MLSNDTAFSLFLKNKTKVANKETRSSLLLAISPEISETILSKMASAAESNLKYRAILNSMPSLIDLIDKGDPMKLALRLFQEGLLKEYTYDELLLECKTGTDKARKIVFEIHSQAEVNPVETYEKLIEVLNKEEMFNAVKLIEERYKMGKSIHFFIDFRSDSIITSQGLFQAFTQMGVKGRGYDLRGAIV